MPTRIRDAGPAAGSESPADAGSPGSPGSETRVTPRWRYPIEPTMPASGAAAVILESLLEVVVDNRAGVIERRDPEFLHDYRVAVRRTRSALSLFGAALPPAMLRRGREFFKNLGRRTNNARDLDVLLLELPAYARSIPTSDRDGLAKLEQRIVRENARHYADVHELLEGEPYGRALTAWRSDLAELSTTDRGGPIASHAAGAIQKAARRVYRLIERIEGEDSDASVHRLRIGLKRLRYSLEFSAALTAGGEAEKVIGSLKRMQDQLGAHQDLAVHQQRIAELAEGTGDGAALEAVVRELTEGLRYRQVDLRHSIQRDVAIFRRQVVVELDPVLRALD